MKLGIVFILQHKTDVMIFCDMLHSGRCYYYYYYYYYRLDFTPIKKCNELDELVMPICLLFDIPILAENFTRQMMEISGVM